jgi:hypothetical protein
MDPEKMPEACSFNRPFPCSSPLEICLKSLVKKTAIHKVDVYQPGNPKAIEKRVAIS